MKNNNDNLKEKAINANELENISGGSGDAGAKYYIDLDGRRNYCDRNYNCGNACYNVCPTRAIYWVKSKRINGWKINHDACTGCGQCASQCTRGYIKKY